MTATGTIALPEKEVEIPETPETSDLVEPEMLDIADDHAASTYGFANHFRISPLLKETAERYGIVIAHRGLSVATNNRFEVRSKHGEKALRDLVSPLFSPAQGQDYALMTRKELTDFLNFLHRPLSAPSRKHKSYPISERVLRFMTTGKVEKPRYQDNALENAKSLECHLKGQRKMQEKDAEATQPQLANPQFDTLAPEEHGKLASSIPNTAYDPARGFVFKLHADHLDGTKFIGTHQNLLSETMWDVLNQVTQGRYASPASRGGEIALSAAEFSDFCMRIERHAHIAPLIGKAQVQERAAALYENVIEDAARLQADPRFHLALERKATKLDPNDKLNNLLHATTFFTPLMRSGDMFEAWRDSYFIEHLLKLTNPTEDIPEQLEAFALTLHRMIDEGRNSHADIQALINNSRSLLSFEEKAAESLEQAAQHKKAQRLGVAEERAAFVKAMGDMRTGLAQASVNGISASEPEGYYDELLGSMRNTFGQNGNAVKQTVVGGFETYKGFWQGVADSVYDCPPVFIGIAGLIGYAFWTRQGMAAPDTALITDALQPLADDMDRFMIGWDGDTGTNNSALAITPQELSEANEISENMLEQAVLSGEVDAADVGYKGAHWHYFLPQPVLDALDSSLNFTVSNYLKFRHTVGQDIIASGALVAQDMMVRPLEITYAACDIDLNPDTVFKSVSSSTASACGTFAVDANMFQDGSHATMIGYSMMRAARYGAGSTRGMLGLSAEFINPIRRLALKPLNPVIGAGAFVLGAAGVVSPQKAAATVSRVRARPKRHENFVTTAMALSSDAEGHMVLADEMAGSLTVDKNFVPADIKINQGVWGLQSHAITIGPDNIAELETAINELALTMHYSAGDIGVEADAYKEFITACIGKVEQALKDHRAAPHKVDAKRALEKALNGPLQHIIGAEIRFNDKDDIYRALFPETTGDPKTRGFFTRLFTDKAEVVDLRRSALFARHASKKHGRLDRSENRAERAQLSRMAENKHAKPETLLSKQSLKYAWGEALKAGSKLKYRTANGISWLAGGIVNVAREGIQESICQLPLKKKLAAAALATGSTAVALDFAGVKNGLVTAFSGAAAATTSATSSSAVFVALNIPQDFALHTGVVLGGMLTGAFWYYGVTRGLKPLSSGLIEAPKTLLSRRKRNDLDGPDI